jgi:hypothetical protein
MRTIAVRPQLEEDWENLVTSMVVSEKSVDEVTKKQSELPKLRTNQIALFTYTGALDFSIFSDFVEGSFGYNRISVPAGGSIAFGSLRVKTRKFNPLILKVVSKQRRTDETWKWVLTAEDSNTSPDREQLWTIVREQAMVAKIQGYGSMEELIRDILRIENVSHNIDFQLMLFDLAKIKGVNFGDSSFEVEIEKPAGLQNLQLNVNVERTTHGGFRSTVLKKPFPLLEIEMSEEPTQLCLFRKNVELPTLFPFDIINIELIHTNSALTLDHVYLSAPLKNPVEPFYNVLTAFCSLDKFKSMLLKPEEFKDAPEKMFENAVTWLLSLAGFQTICLAANTKATKTSFDVLRKYDRYQIGSADIIAYENNKRLLLVDCDIGGLDEQKIQKLIELGKYFKTLCEYRELEIVPVLFTSKNIREDDKKKPVAIVDGNLIERILEDLSKGDRKSASSKIYAYLSF